jgi:hypothetical protein
MARAKNTPTAAPAAVNRASAFVVTHVRHALQQTVAIGACSLYFPAAWAMRPVQICFTLEV